MLLNLASILLAAREMDYPAGNSLVKSHEVYKINASPKFRKDYRLYIIRWECAKRKLDTSDKGMIFLPLALSIVQVEKVDKDTGNSEISDGSIVSKYNCSCRARSQISHISTVRSYRVSSLWASSSELSACRQRLFLYRLKVSKLNARFQSSNLRAASSKSFSSSTESKPNTSA